MKNDSIKLCKYFQLVVSFVLCAIPIVIFAKSTTIDSRFIHAHHKGRLITQKYLDSQKGKYVEFRSATKIDWRAIAPLRLKQINPSKPTREDLQYIKNEYVRGEGYDIAEFEYDVAISDDVTLGNYYFISPNGIERINPTKLKGSARFRLSRDYKRIIDQIYDGHILGEPIEERSVTDGGFILYSDNSLTFEVEKVRFAADEVRSLLPRKSVKFDEIEEQYRFRVNPENEQYIFIKLDNPKGHTLCHYKYLIITTGNKPKIVGWNMYDCDL